MIETRTNSAVNTECVWIPIDENTPYRKVLLINKFNGMATVERYNPRDDYTHWYPLPVFADDN